MTIVHLAVGARTALAPDEAYYWEWSRRLAAGYLDHPFAIAFFVRAGTAIVGGTALGVRLVAIVASSVTALLLVAIARRLAGHTAAFGAAVLWATMPLSAVGSMIATPDAPSDAFLAAALYMSMLALEAESGADAAGARSSTRWWAMTGLALGLALDAKYTAVLVAAALLTLVASRGGKEPDLSARTRAGRPLMALATALVVFSPVILWNAAHGWRSFRFQIAHGLGPSLGGPLAREAELLGGQIGVASPIAFGLVAVAAVDTLRSSAPRDPRTSLLARTVVIVFAFFAVTALRHRVEANWPAPAYVAAVPLAAAWAVRVKAERWAWGACALGGAISAALLAHVVRPFASVPPAVDPLGQIEGWNDLGRRVDALRSSREHTLIAATSYGDAAEIAFTLEGHPTTFSIDPRSTVMHPRAREDQYALWPPLWEKIQEGDDVVLAAPVAEGGALAQAFRSCFASTEPQGLVVMARGRAERALWMLHGWRASCRAASPPRER
jgi:4-amino-4-deoxy-L-arabinose transferase-like glycosyltransferase